MLGLIIVAVFVPVFDIFVVHVVRAVLPFVIVSRASAWFVPLIATVLSILGWFVVASVFDPVLVVVIF